MVLKLELLKGELDKQSLQNASKFAVLKWTGSNGTLLAIKKTTAIGKEGDLRIAPDIRFIENLHCIITAHLVGSWKIRDMGSEWGTHIKKGKEFTTLEQAREHVLEHGDIIVLGPKGNPNSIDFLVL
ncbi:MAG TPA: FHA domain-containing protein [Candidatus Nanoarchaeia archaeon]|nr:FHA domain-containing protein [Candidatus Nanoarchaeia archaeon]